MKRRLSLVVVLSFFLCVGLSSAATLNLWDVFPQSNQGENGIYLKVYDQWNGTSWELSYLGDYAFGTSGMPWNIPYVERGGSTTWDSPPWSSPWIVTHPLGTEYGAQQETFLLLSFPQEVHINSISGSVDPWDGGNVNFKIVASKMDGSSIMLYDASVGSSPFNYSVGPQTEPIKFLSFHVAPNADSYCDTTLYSATIDYTPVPLPSSMLLLGSALPLLPFLRRKV